ncbi:hypothetical protein BABINDRAFT_169919 [Babjeviella inositovora NRRL Y-12698]|uniref:Thymidylate kinase n=1 Tax=Babjeviella inositovora NRRL Y-12698 TaxID=984486 RepID=A0A1E3QYN2_9ASCO|nr:uncharacterized protein BABINDRAFT_169919 [Babjeviella inositovora NRRL Y-12698]ODQ82731.1 hypothetical protein BABINDRAFT_169919 [Babjeviella inositovora NRRL Y-12698]
MPSTGSHRGQLILVEGLDRCGKTTQTTRLVEKLASQGHKVELVKFPDRSTPIGKLINTYLCDKAFQLSDEAAHLLFSANRWELAATITETLNQGTFVVLDRYVYSGIAYSAAKGLDFDWCASPDKGLPQPDLVIFLTMSTEKLNQRSGFGGERYEISEFQGLVKEKFDKFAAMESMRSIWNVVNVEGKSIEQVGNDVWGLVEGLLQGTSQPIHKFLA